MRIDESTRSGPHAAGARSSRRRRVAGRALVTAALGSALFAAGGEAQLREVRQIIYGMD